MTASGELGCDAPLWTLAVETLGPGLCSFDDCAKFTYDGPTMFYSPYPYAVNASDCKYKAYGISINVSCVSTTASTDSLAHHYAVGRRPAGCRTSVYTRPLESTPMKSILILYLLFSETSRMNHHSIEMNRN